MHCSVGVPSTASSGPAHCAIPAVLLHSLRALSRVRNLRKNQASLIEWISVNCTMVCDSALKRPPPPPTHQVLSHFNGQLQVSWDCSDVSHLFASTWPNHHHNIHCYDIQVYIKTQPNPTNAISNLKNCLEDICCWMKSQLPPAELYKTEAMVIGTPNQHSNVSSRLYVPPSMVNPSPCQLLSLTLVLISLLHSHSKPTSKTSARFPFFHL